jgi:hypothetical protein
MRVGRGQRDRIATRRLFFADHDHIAYADGTRTRHDRRSVGREGSVLYMSVRIEEDHPINSPREPHPALTGV